MRRQEGKIKNCIEKVWAYLTKRTGRGEKNSIPIDLELPQTRQNCPNHSRWSSPTPLSLSATLPPRIFNQIQSWHKKFSYILLPPIVGSSRASGEEINPIRGKQGRSKTSKWKCMKERNEKAYEVGQLLIYEFLHTDLRFIPAHTKKLFSSNL